MGRVQKVEALVLSRRNLGEADRLVTIFTKDQGLIKVVAKGVRKIPSRRGGHLEPLTKIMAVVSGKNDRYFLAGVETLDRYENLRSDAKSQEQIKVLNYLLLSVLPEGEKQQELFVRLAKVWEVLPRVPSKSRYLLEAGLICDVLNRAGLLPQLKSCAQCKKVKPQEAVILDASLGGWRCVTCLSAQQAWQVSTDSSVPADGVEVLRMLVVDPRKVFRMVLPEILPAQILGALRVYISHVIEKPLPVLTNI